MNNSLELFYSKCVNEGQITRGGYDNFFSV